jgi:cysteine synthase
MALAGARQIARELDSGKLVVTLIPDSGERYLSKLNKEWLAARDLL